MKLTFLATGELRSFSADLRLEAVRQTVDELEDVRIGTNLLDLFLRHFLGWLGRAKKNVELDRPVVQSWFLRHQCQMFSVLPDVQLSDLRIIQL